MAGQFKMDDYVDVAQRIHDFYERFPDGRLVTGSPPITVEVGGRPFIWYHARAYRTPDDPLPGDGWAAEPVPGPTQFTKDSELMNAETAAWGRAIVALGFSTKKIASAQEVRNRSGNGSAPKQTPTDESLPGLRNALVALVESKGGDSIAAGEAFDTAATTENFAEWLAFQTEHWTKQTAPLKAPAGVSA